VITTTTVLQVPTTVTILHSVYLRQDDSLKFWRRRIEVVNTDTYLQCYPPHIPVPRSNNAFCGTLTTSSPPTCKPSSTSMPPERISPGSNGKMAEIHTRVEQQRRVVEELRHGQRPNRRGEDSRMNEIGTTNDPETNSRVPTYSTAGNLVASGSTAGAVIQHAVPSTGRRTRPTSRLGNNGVSNEAHSSIPRAAPSTDIVHLKRNSGDLVQSMTNPSGWGIPFSFGMGAAPLPTSARAPSNVTNVTVNLGQQTPPTASSVNAPTSSGSSSTNAGTSSSWDWPDRALWNVTQTIQSRELGPFFHEL
jgi:hypothetical protein